MRKGMKFKVGARSVTGPILMGRIERQYAIHPDTSCWIWAGQRSPSGYAHLWIHHSFVRVSRLMAWMHGKYDGDPALEVCHRCNVKSCINPDHLYAAPHKQNMRDAERDGLVNHPYGENHPNAKLDQDDACYILWALENGHKAADLARAYGVDKSTISLIKRGINWKYLRDDSPESIGEGGVRCD